LGEEAGGVQVIEQLDEEETRKLEEPGEWRFRIGPGILGLVQVELQRKGWFLWRTVEYTYPQFWDCYESNDWTDVEQLNEAVWQGRWQCVVRHRKKKQRAAAEREFYSTSA
jgi:hypothetical protein